MANHTRTETIFTTPGKLGDAILQWPIAFWFHKQTGKKFSFWMDEQTCKSLKPLIEFQDGVESVKLMEGIKTWHMGGQPYHFDLPTEAYNGKEIHHLGMRQFPTRQITTQTMLDVPLALKVDPEDLADTSVFKVPARKNANRCVIHGTSRTHGGGSPGVWKFVASIRKELDEMFDEVVFVGSHRERTMGLNAHPSWKEYDDKKNMLTLAEYLASSALLIGAGSAIAALGGALKIPTIRVHDPIGDHPKFIWENLGKNQLNATELELRTEWPAYREAWFGTDARGSDRQADDSEHEAVAGGGLDKQSGGRPQVSGEPVATRDSS